MSYEVIMFSIISALRKKPCLLCGKPPHRACVFLPKDQLRVSAPPGKVRGVGYTLCWRCHRKPGSRRRVEESIFAALAAPGGRELTSAEGNVR
jgi:hypothetical protein